MHAALNRKIKDSVVEIIFVVKREEIEVELEDSLFELVVVAFSIETNVPRRYTE
jgi:hypothetical protein